MSNKRIGELLLERVDDALQTGTRVATLFLEGRNARAQLCQLGSIGLCLGQRDAARALLLLLVLVCLLVLLRSRLMQQVLQDLSQNPAAAQHHLQNPDIMAKIQKLVEAGVIRVGSRSAASPM